MKNVPVPFHPSASPAFPRPPVVGSGELREEGQEGMSLREWLAGMALCGLVAGFDELPRETSELACVAVQLADETIRQLNG